MIILGTIAVLGFVVLMIGLAMFIQSVKEESYRNRIRYQR